MDDGREVVMRAGDFFAIPPGHDSWVLRDERYVSLHMLGGDEYATWWEAELHVITVRRKTSADPPAVWALWADVGQRPRWDDALDAVELEGPFETGTRGVVRLKDQPERRLEITDCVSPRRFTERVFLPLGANMDWRHSIDEAEDGYEVTDGRSDR